VLAAFRQGEVRTLVATDIAARGIDVDGISHVVNYDVPNVPETYVHRIGRTARAGAAGIAISLCDGEEAAFLRDIEKLIRMTIPASGQRAEQRQAEPRHASGGSIKPAGNARQRRGGRNDPARKQSRPHQANHTQPNHGQPNHGQTNEAPRGIEAVAFMRRNGKPQRDRAPYAPRLAGGPSQGA